MEFVEHGMSWRLGRYANAALERAAAMLSRMSWFGSPRTLPPGQVVSPMSDEWIREHENHHLARGD